MPRFVIGLPTYCEAATIAALVKSSICSFFDSLAPEPIPLFLFTEGREKFGEPLAATLAGEGLDEAVAALRTFALIDREEIADERDPAIKTDCIRLHRLVRQVARTRCVGAARENACRALLRAVAAIYPEGIVNDLGGPGTWPRAGRLDGLASALVAGVAEPPPGAEAAAAELLTGLGAYRLFAITAFEQARQLFERALAIREKVLGREHPLRP
jgi:hypothetical protein